MDRLLGDLLGTLLHVVAAEIDSPVTAAAAERLAGDQFMIVETGQLELAAATSPGLRQPLRCDRKWQPLAAYGGLTPTPLATRRRRLDF